MQTTWKLFGISCEAFNATQPSVENPGSQARALGERKLIPFRKRLSNARRVIPERPSSKTVRAACPLVYLSEANRSEQTNARSVMATLRRRIRRPDERRRVGRGYRRRVNVADRPICRVCNDGLTTTMPAKSIIARPERRTSPSVVVVRGARVMA